MKKDELIKKLEEIKEISEEFRLKNYHLERNNEKLDKKIDDLKSKLNKETGNRQKLERFKNLILDIIAGPSSKTSKAEVIEDLIAMKVHFRRKEMEEQRTSNYYPYNFPHFV